MIVNNISLINILRGQKRLLLQGVLVFGKKTYPDV